MAQINHKRLADRSLYSHAFIKLPTIEPVASRTIIHKSIEAWLLKSKEHPFFQFAYFHLISGDCNDDCVDVCVCDDVCCGEYVVVAGLYSSMNARSGSGAELTGTLSLNIDRSTLRMQQSPRDTLLLCKLWLDISRKGHNRSGSRNILLTQSPLKFSSSFFLTLDIVEAFFCVGNIVDLRDLLP